MATERGTGTPTPPINPMRILAPAALVVFGIAFLLVIVTSGGDSEPASSGSKSADKTRDLGSPKKAKTTPTQTTPATSQATYVVKTGDTLGSIAEKTGVPVSKLQELNPQLDPQALVSGQKIRLRE
jgi:LysM repeat protein